MTLPYVRFDRALGQLEAGPDLHGGAGAYPFLRGGAVTSGAETRTVLSKALPEGAALWYSAQALVKTLGGADVAVLSQTGRASRAAAATTVYTDAISAANSPGLAGISLAVVAAGDDVAVQIGGVAGVEAAWRIILVYDEV
jgi:hypothetical protein